VRAEAATRASASIRIALAALVAASFLAFLVVGRADGAGSWTGYLAPASACPGSADRGASVAVQQRAAACLVNWARARARVSLLRRPAALGRAATLKGRKVASCGHFSHTPCGSDPRAAVHAVGYRYSRLGENLFLGTWGKVSARDAVRAWLGSPSHRENMLRPGFRHLGAALVRARGMRSDGDGALWITEFATPR
jgi:uncharacterized protein YkwD